MSTSQAERHKRWRYKRQALGLCTRCSRPRQNLKWYCDECRAKEKLARIKRRIAKVALSRAALDPRP